MPDSAVGADGTRSKPSWLRLLNPRTYLRCLLSPGDDPEPLLSGLRRRQGWFLERLTLRRFVCMSTVAIQYLLKCERMLAPPPVVKIDISPMCNLRCTVCVHASPNGVAALQKQVFHGRQRMSVERFRRITEEIKHVTSAVSLYYVGDPLMHPDLDAMCSIARDAGLNVHISTNFSFVLTDERLRRMIRSGLTHLSVCVDGLSQEKYQLTRVGGRIERVLDNLRRLCRFKRELRVQYPKVEVQYIKFQHNVDELEAARKVLGELGVDQFTHFWGDLGNYTDRDPGTFDVIAPRRRRRIPLCHLPHATMVIKYNGDVIPCCYYRIGHQYTSVDDPRVLGNVFKTSLREVWNSRAYRLTRRFVADPELVNREPVLKKHFCHGCPGLFDTTSRHTEHFADRGRWEDFYELGADGRPVARRGKNSAPDSAIRPTAELVVSNHP